MQTRTRASVLSWLALTVALLLAAAVWLNQSPTPAQLAGSGKANLTSGEHR